jgi:ABC-type hemin transport system substrate-binding protein
MTDLPVLDDSQRQPGAAKSLALRQARAAIKAQLAAEPSWFPAVLFIDEAAGMKVYDLLRAIPGVAKTRAQAILKMAGIDQTRTVRALGPKQIDRLIAQLRSRKLI